MFVALGLDAGAAEAVALVVGVVAADVLEVRPAEPYVLVGEVVGPDVPDVGAEECLGLVLSALVLGMWVVSVCLRYVCGSI